MHASNFLSLGFNVRDHKRDDSCQSGYTLDSSFNVATSDSSIKRRQYKVMFPVFLDASECPIACN